MITIAKRVDPAECVLGRDTREQAYKSGFVADLAHLCQLPEELIDWMQSECTWYPSLSQCLRADGEAFQ